MTSVTAEVIICWWGGRMRTFPLAALAGAAVLILTACGTETSAGGSRDDRQCPAPVPVPSTARGASDGGVRIISYTTARAAGGGCPASQSQVMYEITPTADTPMTYTITFGLMGGSGTVSDVLTETVPGVRPGETVRRTLPVGRTLSGVHLTTVRSVPTAEAPSQSGPCPRSGVRVYADRGDAAMGLRVVGLHLSNCGTGVYRINGYPEVQLFDEDHDPVTGVRILHGSREISFSGDEPGPTPLVLKPGEAALATLTWRNTTEFGDPVNAPYVRVHAKPGADPVMVTPELDLGTTGKLAVGAWRRLDRS
ncbi:DUF4232 domain-containing protein [Streptomyces sp. XM83C]|uniref:DUF4232 domain-containing protein n=1 Tax=Streptomyces sp. XM83C TaxID=2929781 RepID=UPI0027E478D4|nr:DUF4232 domain-containing protein [Streptomyces sp. XM83C]